jgi:2-pyrone-4,6-dicarboxylate lactonase
MTTPDLPLSAPHDPHPRKPSVAVPANAVDTHAHVLLPGYPLLPTGLYTPAPALGEEFRHMLDTLGVKRGVLVQPSIYAFDNSAMLDVMAKDKHLHGVAVVPFDVEVKEIERLHAKGVRGVRLNIVDLKFGKGKLDLDALRSLARKIQPFGWHAEFLMHVDEFPDLDQQIGGMPIAFSFGHLGYVYPDRGLETAGFKALLRLMKDGKAWVKMTAPYRFSALGKMPFPDSDAFAQALVDAAPERLLWGSDWPHVFIRTAMPNDGELLDLFAKWVPDARMRKRILVDNPAKVYGFPG